MKAMNRVCSYIVYFVIIIIVSNQSVNALTLKDEWIQQYGSAQYDILNSITEASDNGYIAVGSTNGTVTDGSPLGNNDGWILKTDIDGNEVWSKQYGSSQYDSLQSVIKTSDGGYIAAGHTRGTVTDGIALGNYDGWIIKFDASGNEVWSKQYGSTETDQLRSILQTSDGGYIAAGYTQGVVTNGTAFPGYNDGWILKIDNLGNEVWSKQYGNISGENNFDELFSITDIGNNNYVAVGRIVGNTTNSTHIGSEDGWVLRIDANGTEVWSKQYGTDSDDRLHFAKLTSDNKLIIAGYTGGALANGTHLGSDDGWIMNLDLDGNKIWSKQYGTDSIDSLYSINEVSDGSYIVTGYTYGTLTNGTNYGSSDYWFLRVDSQGNILYSTQYGNEAQNNITAGIIGSDGSYVGVGITSGTPLGNVAFGSVDGAMIKVNDLYALKFNSNGGQGNINSLSLSYLDTINLPSNTFTKIDNVFLGWATSQSAANNGVVTYIDQQSFTQNIRRDNTLYAVWKNNAITKYKVIYFGNGNTKGSAPIDSKEYIKGSNAVILNQGNLSKDGYTFNGWNTKSNGSGTNYKVGNKVTIQGNKSLYAQWKKNTSSIIDGQLPNTGVNNTQILFALVAMLSAFIGYYFLYKKIEFINNNAK